MKRIMSLLIKFGLFAGIIAAAVMTNPKAVQHKNAILAKQARLQDEDVLGKTERMIHQSPQYTAKNTEGFIYHNYIVCSKVTDPEKGMASFGFFKKVFVTQNEL